MHRSSVQQEQLRSFDVATEACTSERLVERGRQWPATHEVALEFREMAIPGSIQQWVHLHCHVIRVWRSLHSLGI